MITADDVDTLLFDVLGTVVDEAGSMRAELAAALDRADAGRQAEVLAAAWARRFAALVSSIGEGAPWRSADDLNAEALAGVLRDGPQLPEATVRHLALAGHRLRPRPDAQAALRCLAGRFTIVALSNGNLSMLTDLFAAARDQARPAAAPAYPRRPAGRRPPARSCVRASRPSPTTSRTAARSAARAASVITRAYSPPLAARRERGPSMTTPVTTLDQRYSDPDAVATGWDQTRQVLESAEVSWISTVRADGRPHVTPCAAVWLDGTIYFDTGATQQKAINLRANPHVILTTGCNHWDSGLDVVVEGDAVRVTDDNVLRRLAEVWATKWDGRFRFQARDGCFHHDQDEGFPVLVFSVTPAKVLAFTRGPLGGHTTHRF